MLNGRTHGNDLGSDERKRGLVHNGPKPKETPFHASNAIVLDERTRVFPITETETIVIGASPEVEDKSQNNQA